IEVRGLGIAKLPAAAEGKIVLVFEMAAPEKIDRLPTPAQWEGLGIAIPAIKLDPFAASAGAKVRLAVRKASQGTIQDIIVEP
ncbi:MAG: aldolase, partial [Rhodospirillales bacterium]